MIAEQPASEDVSVLTAGSRTSDYDYELPSARIAQRPVEPRDGSRLLVLDRAANTLTHRTFRDLAELIPANDAIVVNTTRVFRARLLGRRDSGGPVSSSCCDQWMTRTTKRWCIPAANCDRDVRLPSHQGFA